ncbi:MAG: Nif3-like dinuclear metal center hexameric protein [Elusimicrobiales bacterium]|nr:Nif3-like dinuclear metal center hexameric protein [Elusimicrobiales bacterium]
MRDKITRFINEYLKIRDFADSSFNGLQVEGKNEIKKILFAVSYSKIIGDYAAKHNFDMIIVHHGLFWGKEQPITGIFKKRIEPLIKNDINLLAYHLPLDAHPKIGNNISLIKLFPIKNITPFGDYKGKKIGFKAVFKKPVELREIIETIKKNISKNPLVLNFGEKKINSMAVISGGASSFLEQAINEKIDLYLTGEPSEYVFELAKESKKNFIAAGHYRTEVFGIKNLQNIIRKKFKPKTEFLDTENPI